jgi:predicted DNA binding protein
MSVVAELHVAAEQFELGRILAPAGETRLELERVVPTGDAGVLLLWAYETDAEEFVTSVRNYPSVDSFEELDRFESGTLYTLHWDAESDHFFDAVCRERASLLRATAADGTWRFELRFHSHDSLSAFQRHCENARIRYDVRRVSAAEEPTVRPWNGLTERQREALVLAVETGYYDIPRRRSTVDLAEELGISDQAVTERLRRAIVALTTDTLLDPDTPEPPD